MEYKQYIKISRFYAKLCRTIWSNSKNNIKIYVYPMMHVGERDFYKKISEELEQLNIILVEGIGKGKKGKSRYDLLIKKSTLVTQNELKYPKNIEIKNIDMNYNEFQKNLNKLSLKHI